MADNSSWRAAGDEMQTDRSARGHRDRQAPVGRATHDVPGRVLASCAQAGPVGPQFPATDRGVRSGGVLTAPPTLQAGLVECADGLVEQLRSGAVGKGFGQGVPRQARYSPPVESGLPGTAQRVQGRAFNWGGVYAVSSNRNRG